MPDIDDLTPEHREALMAQMQQRENAGLTQEQIEQRNKERELKKKANLKEIEETLTICKNGYYIKNSAKILLNPKNADLSDAKVYLPDEIPSFTSNENVAVSYTCQNMDCLSLALKYPREDVLVLNLASYTRPGGGTKDGANGQEEDLCRRTTLLESLESENAKSFFDFNNSLKSRLGSNALIYSPNVAVFRDENGALLDVVQYIAVLSCAAPMIRFGLEGKTQQEYEDLLYCRLKGILNTAASLGYKHLILGAFGCGAYGNDAKIVSDIFKKALDEIHYFTNVDFAV
ncbi:MAG: TIGR02452 family protein, partial [Coprobacillus sp.]|nr:TIGR02452 family protein [Coprobacillus sp.]